MGAHRAFVGLVTHKLAGIKTSLFCMSVFWSCSSDTAIYTQRSVLQSAEQQINEQV